MEETTTDKKEREVLNINISLKEDEVKIVPLEGDEENKKVKLKSFAVAPQKGSCVITITGDIDEVKATTRSILSRTKIKRRGYRFGA